ncbi:S8 family serine peptidase [Dokdonella sp.]|uniref:S8 family serine peptidase n=1 Tax=Dokdonella sp. TaxID=2291710 RepID=UPI0035291D33
MRNTVRVKTLAVLITASLGGVCAPVAWSQATVADEQGSVTTLNETATYMIRFADPGALAYRGGIGSLQGTAAPEGERFNAKSPEALAYRQFLEQEQAAFIASMKAALGRDVSVPHTYQITHSGLAAKLTPAEAARVASMPGVVSIKRDKMYQLDTFRGPSFIGATDVWNGAVPTPGTAASFGKGVVIGVVDSGVNATHPSFANDPRCGFGAGDVKLRSFVDCSSSTAGVCNGANPLDTNGHGSHTASTSGGNMLDNTVSPPPAIPPGYTNISGVAPCATIRTYKVCPGSTCPGADITAGLSNVLIDGDIDVVNYSISGGEVPWDPSESDRAFLDFVDNDIFVAASAGNTRAETPDPVGEVNHLGPWVMTVASSTHDQNPVGGTLSAAGPGTPPANTQNLVLSVAGINVGTGGVIPIRVNAANDIGCTASGGFPPGFFDNAAALIMRGTCSFEEKLNNAQAAGALVGFVYNNAAGTLNMAIGGATLPAYGMLQVDGQALRAFIDSNGATPTTVDFTPATKIGDLLSDFSLRGPTSGDVVDLTKPDITAPGDNIYAAYIAPNNYAFLGGTSMSSPHTAGSGALIRAMNPTWSPMAIKSALQMTAKRTGVQEDGTTPWNADQIGNGRVQVGKAVMAGLVLEESVANFLAANPNGGSIDIKTLNIPSMRNTNCTPNCTFTRTVTSKLATSSTWNASFESADGVSATVSPSSFTIAAGATQALTITVTPDEYGPNNQLPNHPSFGDVVLVETGALSPDEHMTVAIRAVRDGIFKDGYDGDVPPPNPNLVTFVLNAPVFNNINGTCLKFLTGVIRDNLASCTGDDFNAYTASGTPDRLLSFFWSYTGATANRGGMSTGTAYTVAAPGAVIGPAATFIDSAGGTPTSAWRVAGGVDGYLGFRFLNTDTATINYGYLRINNVGAVGVSGMPATLVSYTFDNSGAAITIPTP